MPSLMIACPSMGGHREAVTTWQDTMSKPWPVRVYDQLTGDDAGFLAKCDKAWRETDATVIGYLHSDLYIHEFDWDKRVLAEFTKPDVAVVGFMGATQLGYADIYKLPYDFHQLARGDTWSNFTDWRQHGGHETGTRRVAVIDSCAVFVRRDFLDRLGGWPRARYPDNPHCSDLWLCCMAHRHHCDVRMVGVVSTHRSGGKGPAGVEWIDKHYESDLWCHRRAHELIYEEFRDILPVIVS